MLGVIRKYYLEDVINLHNKDSFRSFDLNKRIDSLRNLIKQKFSWEGEVVFFPNLYYAKRTVFENFKSRKMFSNEIDSWTMKDFSFEKITCCEGLNSKEKSLLFWKGELGDAKIGDNFFVLSEVDWNSGCPDGSDAFVTGPMDGIAVLGFKKELRPFYLGSNSFSSVNRDGFELSTNASSFECGTGNYALLLFLEGVLGKE